MYAVAEMAKICEDILVVGPAIRSWAMTRHWAADLLNNPAACRQRGGRLCR
jgi:hypothetical protein